MNLHAMHHHDTGGSPTSDRVEDPVCGMTIRRSDARATREHQGRTYYFCSPGCASAFDADPGRYLTAATR